ncbi:8-oxo-dGTP diphosphatase [Rhodococcoides trifolii]|uniref:8-oxo-dGTP diphosphatase n=1 Tax=Rhodococcoides trifolii TaxID=908250 RepID=A0A917CS03_9NOCA|nr:NUDIX hydrolase [Rhodococcus trifolii]GGF94511.1 8-oxo-dGTP diphosphatase [Rhodococcus trifolii]
MQGDGDGWVFGADGTRHWGRNGAAGLLLRAPDQEQRSMVLLQHRAAWSHQGGTWALPGGAMDSHESPVDAAVREAGEEAGIRESQVAVRAERVTATADSGWSYTTVVADADHALSTVPNGESTELRWVAEADVDSLPLHPAFAVSWPTLRAPAVDVVLDTANLLGAVGTKSGESAWWRDRPGATTALLSELAASLPRTLELPSGGFGWVSRIVAVLEGDAATAVSDHPAVVTVVAPPGGDDTVVELASQAVGPTLVVTADKGLRGRLPHGVDAVGPSALGR